MSDINRESYLKMMGEIQDLEDELEGLEKKDNPEQLEKLRQQLDEKRHELQRISDGCGRPHAH